MSRSPKGDLDLGEMFENGMSKLTRIGQLLQNRSVSINYSIALPILLELKIEVYQGSQPIVDPSSILHLFSFGWEYRSEIHLRTLSATEKVGI